MSLQFTPREIVLTALFAALTAIGAFMVIYFLGVLGLYININWVQSKPMSLTTALKIGFLLPLPGDLVKMGVATLVTLPARERLQALMTKDA